ncbi:MAG TPA: LysR family transcriptional regulator [Candidatus Yaniella excrementigallinarum]|nr:LysR family transcriptional regulator [Candidatus Yaniella excrementigallinarum]
MHRKTVDVDQFYARVVLVELGYTDQKDRIVELRQLEYFLAVAEELHFGRAAARLNISQPPLTVHIKRLEEELGLTLFDRTSRRVSLTPEGSRFRDLIRPILQDLDEAVEDIREIKAGRRGRVRVGFVSSASYALIPAGVRDVRTQHPGIHLELNPMATGEQVEALLENRLDIGIMRDAPLQAGLQFTTLLTEQMVVVVPTNHQLAAQDEVSPAHLAEVPLVLFPYQSMPGYVTNIMEIFHPIGQSPRIAQRAVNQENVMGLVAAGVGASILPASFSSFSFPGVVTKPITTRPTTRLELVTDQQEVSANTAAVVAVLSAAAQRISRDQNAAHHV